MIMVSGGACVGTLGGLKRNLVRKKRETMSFKPN
jgi:hypothetical protein